MKEHLRTHGPDYSSSIAEELGKDRSDITRVLKDAKSFVLTGIEGKKRFYGLRSDREEATYVGTPT